jgi:hypothetical protein
MSDQEVVLQTSQGEEIKPAEQSPVTEIAEVTETPAEKEADKTFTQAELDAIVQKRISKLERKMERQQIEQETRQKVLQEIQSKPEPVQGKPKIEDFTDYSEYQEALTDWKVDQRLSQIESQKAQKASQETEQSKAERINQRSQEIMEEGSAKYDDFDEMPQKTAEHLKSKGLRLSVPFVNALAEADNAPDIVAHLYQNPDEAERIARLSEFAQAKEVGKLEDRLSAKKPIKTSTAPKPIEPITGSNSSVKSIENMSQREYAEYRAKQGARWAR